MRFWGIISTGTSDEPAPGKAIWLLDGVEVEEGLDVFVQAPDVGKHSLKLVVEIGKEQVERTVSFVTVEYPDAAEE
jgi:hypothetical protein